MNWSACGSSFAIPDSALQIHFGDEEVNETTDSLTVVLMAKESLKYPLESELLTKLNLERMQLLRSEYKSTKWPSAGTAGEEAVDTSLFGDVLTGNSRILSSF